MTNLEDFKGLEDLLHVVGKRFNFGNDLVRSLELVLFEHQNTVTSHKAGDEFTSALSKELGDCFALADKGNLKVDLALCVDHNGTLVAECK